LDIYAPPNLLITWWSLLNTKFNSINLNTDKINFLSIFIAAFVTVEATVQTSSETAMLELQLKMVNTRIKMGAQMAVKQVTRLTK